MKEEVRHSIVGDDEVDPAVIVDINRSDPERLGRRHSGGWILNLDPACRRDIGKMTVPVVAIEIWKSSFEIHGLPVSAADPDQFVAHLEIDFLGPANVIADEEIQQAIVVVVDPSATGAPLARGTTYTSTGSDVFELPLAVVVKEVVLAYRRDEDVDPTI